MTTRAFVRLTTLAAAAVLGLAALPASAGESNGAPNSAPKADPKAQTEESAVARIGMAADLADWGRASKSPEALLAAAQIVAEIPVEAREVKKDSKQGEAAPAAGQKTEEPPIILDPVALQKEALAIATAKGDKVLQKHAEALVKGGATGTRGASGGPKVSTTRVSSGYTDVFNVQFDGGGLAEVAISGDGDTDLDLYVYDENGNYIASDTGSTDTAYVSWTPRWTGTFRVEVKNRGNVYNQYTIITN